MGLRGAWVVGAQGWSSCGRSWAAFREMLGLNAAPSISQLEAALADPSAPGGGVTTSAMV